MVAKVENYYSSQQQLNLLPPFSLLTENDFS